jgi:cytochrome c oxidase cbb3-type subunit III
MIRPLYILLCLMCVTGCGKPTPSERSIRPSNVLDFDTLFAQRCAGCHGNDGAGSGAIALNDPAYLSVSGKFTIRDLITNGRDGTLMPSFQSNTGNPLTDAQIDAIVLGMSEHWSGEIPPFADGRRYEVQQGDASKGRGAFADLCAECHGQDGLGNEAGSVVSPDYLALVSPQYLRSVILFGRPELGMPQFAGKTDDQTIDDIVAWLQSHRKTGAHNK